MSITTTQVRRALRVGLVPKILFVVGIVTAISATLLINAIFQQERDRITAVKRAVGENHATQVDPRVVFGELERTNRDGKRSFIELVLLLSALSALFILVFLHWQVTRPLARLADAARRLETGKFSERIVHRTSDEIGEVVTAFNLMGEAVVFRQEQLENEMSLAKKVQTSLLPRNLRSPSFEMAARMRTLGEVGGDYYDVIPVTGGVWIAIGDVSGHGFNAGLVMLMVQSAVAALVRKEPNATPRDLLMAANDVIFDNVKTRLGGDDFVTLTLLRCDNDGQVLFAGAHEELVIFRQEQRVVERIQTPGTWIGASSKIGAATRNSEFTLEAGDALVLYTDGIIEARNEKKELFGVDRLSEALESLGRSSAQTSVDQLFERVLTWSNGHVHDDMSLLVLRRRGTTTLPSSTKLRPEERNLET